MLLSKGQYSKARQAAVEALAREPEDAYLHSLIGRAYLGLNDPLQAHSFVSKAVALAPGESSFLAQLGIIELTAGNQRQAAETLRSARSIDPDNLYVLNLSISVLLADPKIRNPLRRDAILDEASAVADGAVSAHPNSPSAHIARARVHVAAKEYAEAEDSARYALAIEPNNADALTLLGKAAAKQGRTHDAGDFLIQASKADPTSDQALSELRSISSGWLILLGVVVIAGSIFLGTIGGPTLLVIPLIMAAAIGGIVMLGDMLSKWSERNTARRKLHPDAQDILDQDRKFR